jgi:hypothetical protein
MSLQMSHPGQIVTVPPPLELVRKVARELATVRGELTQVEEQAADLQDAAGVLAEHLTVMGVPEEEWDELADKPEEEEVTEGAANVLPHDHHPR